MISVTRTRNALLGLTLGGVLVMGSGWTVAAQTVPETPNEADIPQPVEGEISLAGSDLPDITRFLNVRTAGSPSLSPDGTKLAFRTTISGQPQLWVIDSRGGWPKQLTFGESVTFHQWSPSGDWIIYGIDRGGNEREGFYLINPNGTRERELLAPSDAFRVFGGFTRDGSRIAYATTERNGVDFDVHLYDVLEGTDREVMRGEMGLFAASWRPDGGAVILSETRGEDANNVYVFDIEAGTLDTLFLPDDRSSYGSFSWIPDGSAFYLVTDQDRNYSALARYDFADGDLRFVETPDRDVESVDLSTDGRYLVWTTNDGGYSGMHARDLMTGRNLTTPELPRGIYSVSWAWRANIASITVAGPRTPGDIWIWDVGGGSVNRGTESDAAGLDLGAMVEPEHFSFEARDRQTIHGLLYMPPNLTAGTRPPVLLSVHGGPTAQARPRFNGAHQYLLTRGVAIFDLNYRGSTGYGKEFARLNDRRLRSNEYLDMADAVEWLRSRGDVDASRVAVMGGSYGGYLTMTAVARLPEYFRSGVAFVGVSNWVTALEGASPQLKASDRIEYGDINDPDDREFFREISPITFADQIRVPVMVLHGANDPRDPVTESDQFVRAIRESGGRVEYLRFPDEGHGIRRLPNRIIAYRRIARFLEVTLGLSSIP